MQEPIAWGTPQQKKLKTFATEVAAECRALATGEQQPQLQLAEGQERPPWMAEGRATATLAAATLPLEGSAVAALVADVVCAPLSSAAGGAIGATGGVDLICCCGGGDIGADLDVGPASRVMTLVAIAGGALSASSISLRAL